MAHITNKVSQADMLIAVNKAAINLAEAKIIKHIKPKTENKIPAGFSVSLNFSNVYIAQKSEDGQWKVEMKDGSPFLKEICPRSMKSFSEVCSNIRLFDKEGSLGE
jgi:hypothetical protein